MAACMHTKIIMSLIEMNAGDGSSFFKKLLLVLGIGLAHETSLVAAGQNIYLTLYS